MTRGPGGAPGTWRAPKGLMALPALAALAAGCGGAAAPAHVAIRSRPLAQPDTYRRPPWPPGGSAPLARSVGRRMLASLVLPPGSRRTAARQHTPPAEVIGSDNLVDLHRFFLLRMPVLTAATFVNRHTPRGFRPNGPELGTTTSQNGAVEWFVSFKLRSVPTGTADDTMLLVSFSDGPHGSTVARADAEVVWYPPRT